MAGPGWAQLEEAAWDCPTTGPTTDRRILKGPVLCQAADEGEDLGRQLCKLATGCS